MIGLSVFLGNPGRQYSHSRHNLPWIILDQFSMAGALVWQRKFKGEYAEYLRSGNKLFFHKPMTFMNRSGESIAAIAAFFKFSADQILIIHDDVELEFGEIGLKYGGGLAAHNGLRSTAQHLGSRDFYRLRIGIGRPGRGSVSSYVLGKLTDKEYAAVPEIASRTESVLSELLDERADINRLVERYRRHLVLRI